MVLARVVYWHQHYSIRTALERHRQEKRSIKVAYNLHDADLVGNKKILEWESLVADLEYGDNM